MPGANWGEDSASDEAIISTNVAAVVRAIVAPSARTTPTMSLPAQWHRSIYQGTTSAPGAHYLGSFRGSAHPDLIDYEVGLWDGAGNLLSQGTAAADVAGDLAHFEHVLRQQVARLDSLIAPGSKPADRTQLLMVIELAAAVHGEWIRIHPFANGNGRVARTWANWVAVRYGLPPFVRVKPRPDHLMYGKAAHASMGAPPATAPDHQLTVQVFLDMLRNPPAP